MFINYVCFEISLRVMWFPNHISRELDFPSQAKFRELETPYPNGE
jgi:hypothetical protein